MVTKQITLNVWKKNSVILAFIQGESDSRYIEVTFKDESENLSLANRQVTFYAQKPDGTLIFNDCDVDSDKNTATVAVTSQMESVSGFMDCEFQIFNSENSLLKVNGLKILIVADKDFSEAIESTSEYNALIKALNDAQASEGDLEKYLGEAGELSNRIGTLSDLTTQEKNSLVGAVNEVNSSLISDVNTINESLSQLNTKIMPITQGGTGGVTAEEARTNLAVETMSILYSNESGTRSTVTLADSAENYSEIEIWYRNESETRGSARVRIPNGKTVDLKSMRYSSQGLRCSSSLVTINGTTITWKDGFSGSKHFTDLSGNNADTSSSLIWILQVTGYSY